MINIKISKEIKNKATSILNKINLGRRGVADGNYEEQRVGLIGQLIIYKLYNFQNYRFEENNFDGGFDIIINKKKCDIKTMGRTVDIKDHYVHNFIGLQKNYENDLYIFNSYNKKKEILQVCGWINKIDFFDKCKLYKKGSKRFRDDGSYFFTKTDLYEIKNINLIKINLTEDLKKVGKEN